MSQYQVPTKKILDKEMLERFLVGPTCNDFIAFLEKLNESVKGLNNDSPVNSTPVRIQFKFPFQSFCSTDCGSRPVS